MTSVSGASAQDYETGEAAYFANDFKTAFKEWMPLAESGDASAQTSIGTLYTKGAGVIQSDIEAVKWYRLAASQGDALGQGKLGLMYALGKGVIQSDIEAVKWYRLAAGQGYAEVQALLGEVVLVFRPVCGLVKMDQGFKSGR